MSWVWTPSSGSGMMEFVCHSPQGMKHQSLMASGMCTPLRCLPNQDSWEVRLQPLLDRKTSEH